MSKFFIKSAPMNSRRLATKLAASVDNDDDDGDPIFDDFDFGINPEDLSNMTSPDGFFSPKAQPRETNPKGKKSPKSKKSQFFSPQVIARETNQRKKSPKKKKKRKDKSRSRSNKSVEIKASKQFDIEAFKGASVTHRKKELRTSTAQLGMDCSPKPGVGMEISEAKEGLPVHSAGLRAGDLIVRINSKCIDTNEGFSEIVKTLEPGDDLMLKVQRGSDLVTVRVVVGAEGYTEEEILKIRQETAKDHIKPTNRLEEIEIAREKLKRMKVCLGMVIKAVPHENQGLAVESVEVDGPAGRSGIEKGDIITDMKDKRITDTTAFFDTYQKLEPGEKVKFKVLRKGEKKVLKVRLGANGFTMKEVKKIYKLAKSNDPGIDLISPDVEVRALSPDTGPEKKETTSEVDLLDTKTSTSTSTSTSTTTTTTKTSNDLSWTDLGDPFAE